MFGRNSVMPVQATEESIALQPPEAQANIRPLLGEIAELRARIEVLEGQRKGKTPQNSSLPPSTPHRAQTPNKTRPVKAMQQIAAFMTNASRKKSRESPASSQIKSSFALRLIRITDPNDVSVV